MFAGMKNNELLGELKGRIAGESRQQVQEYIKDCFRKQWICS